MRYRAGLCEGCWSGCCTLPVEVSLHDLMRLELVTPEEASILSPKEISHKLMRSKVIQGFSQKTQIFVLAQKYGRDCLFLDADRRCTVYEKRPEVCRQFPKIGPRPGYCPGARRAKTQSKTV